MQLVAGLAEADRARLNDWERLMLRDPAEAAEIRHRAGLRRPHYEKDLFKNSGCTATSSTAWLTRAWSVSSLLVDGKDAAAVGGCI
jgi:hypothetical protein